MEGTIPVESSAESVNSGGLLSPLFGSSSTIHHQQSDAHLLTEALGSFYSTNSAVTLGSQDNFVDIQDVQESDVVETAITQPEIIDNNVTVAQLPKRPRGPPPKRIPVSAEERELVRELGHDADNLALTSFYGVIDNSISEMLIEGMDRMGEEERRVSFNLAMNSQIVPSLTHELISSAKDTGQGHHEMLPDEESQDIVDAAVDDTTFPASFPVDSVEDLFQSDEGGEWLEGDVEVPLDDPSSSSSRSSSERLLWYSGMDDEGVVCFYHRVTGEVRYDDPFAAVSISPAVYVNEDDTIAIAPIPTELADDITIPSPPDVAEFLPDPQTSPEHVEESAAEEDEPIPDITPSYITPISPNTYASSYDVSLGYEEGTMYKGNIASPAATDIIGASSLLPSLFYLPAYVPSDLQDRDNFSCPSHNY